MVSRTVLALTNSETLTWFVSELGFWDFQLFDVQYLFVVRHILGKSGGEISRKNDKGVLDKPWTKRRVLTAISSTLKFQFTVNPES